MPVSLENAQKSNAKSFQAILNPTGKKVGKPLIDVEPAVPCDYFNLTMVRLPEYLLSKSTNRRPFPGDICPFYCMPMILAGYGSSFYCLPKSGHISHFHHVAHRRSQCYTSRKGTAVGKFTTSSFNDHPQTIAVVTQNTFSLRIPAPLMASVIKLFFQVPYFVNEFHVMVGQMTPSSAYAFHIQLIQSNCLFNYPCKKRKHFLLTPDCLK